MSGIAQEETSNPIMVVFVLALRLLITRSETTIALAHAGIDKETRSGEQDSS